MKKLILFMAMALGFHQVSCKFDAEFLGWIFFGVPSVILYVSSPILAPALAFKIGLDYSIKNSVCAGIGFGGSALGSFYAIHTLKSFYDKQYLAPTIFSSGIAGASWSQVLSILSKALRSVKF